MTHVGGQHSRQRAKMHSPFSDFYKKLASDIYQQAYEAGMGSFVLMIMSTLTTMVVSPPVCIPRDRPQGGRGFICIAISGRQKAPGLGYFFYELVNRTQRLLYYRKHGMSMAYLCYVATVSLLFPFCGVFLGSYCTRLSYLLAGEERQV